MAAGTKSSREDAEAAGWGSDGYPRSGNDVLPPSWCDKLKEEREGPKWDSFSWLTVRALFGSINDLFAKTRPGIVDERRARWVASQRGRTSAASADLVIEAPPPRAAEQPNGVERAFLLVGDTGEQDASQYAVAPYLTAAATASDPRGRHHPPEFLQIVSDVIYPAGDINEYVNGFYIPYREFEKPIYALPGNHDWYDGLDGFMYHFCGAEPLPPEQFRGTEIRPFTRLVNFLWRRSAVPERERLSRWRDSRSWQRDASKAVQPAPYFALDLGDLMLVSIDTGVTGAIDDEQGRWLLRVSALRKQKILLTGKPIYVNGAYHPGGISWQRSKRESEKPPRFKTVDDIVRHEEFGYLAAIGGDVHNYQRYPVTIEEQERKIYYLVSGGGGAYLSPTHRIGPLEEAPKAVDGWPEGLSMPPDEDVPAARYSDPDDENGGEDEDEADAFHCYPQRGDSLAYTARRAGPRMFNLVQTVAAAFVAAAAILLYADPPGQAGGLAIATAYLPLLPIGLLFVILGKLGRDSGPPAPWRPSRGRYGLAAVGFFALLAFTLTALGAGSIDDGVLSSPRFWGTAFIALAVPALLLGAILWAHDLRGSTPAALPQLAVAGAFAAAIPILHPFGEFLGAPAWIATVLFVLAFMAVAMLAVGALRAHTHIEGNGASTGRIAGNVLDRLLVIAAPTLLAFALWQETNGDGVAWLAVALAWCGAWPLLVGAVAKTLDPSRLDGAERRLARIGRVSRFLSTVAWVASAAILLHMIDDGWVATAAIGAVATLAIALGLFAIVLLAAGTVMKRFFFSFAIALLLLAAPYVPLTSGTTIALFVVAGVALHVVAILNVMALSRGRIDADAAQTRIREILNEGSAGEVSEGPRHRTEMPKEEESLFDLLYPYRWAKRNRDQGAQRTNPLAQTVATLLAELGDSDEPPFFKNLLRVDIGDRQLAEGEDSTTAPNRQLTIRCFGVTGFEREEKSPPIEDEITICFRSPQVFEALFPQSTGS